MAIGYVTIWIRLSEFMKFGSRDMVLFLLILMKQVPCL
ncbi:unnamed protein product [Camellia sinensis]